MKLFGITVYYKGAQVRSLKGAYDLQNFNFFQRSSIQEFMVFTGKIIVERSSQPCRTSVKEQEYMCHAYIRADGLSGVVVADTEYPQAVALRLITKVLDEFAQKVPDSSWPTLTEGAAAYPGLDAHLARYQNPTQADPMSRIENELEDTKVVLHNTIQSVLERGEKLDDLVDKSEALSSQSKMFYKSARKMNRCCSWV